MNFISLDESYNRAYERAGPHLPTPFLYLKIFGERNTGSNLLQKICAANLFASILQGNAGTVWRIAERLSPTVAVEGRADFRQAMQDLDVQRMLSSEFGWKHAAPQLQSIKDRPHAEHTVFLVLTKHPYSWAKSLFKNPYDYRERPTNFSDFIRRSFSVNLSDGLALDRQYNPIEMLRQKSLAYNKLLGSQFKTIHLRYEDLLVDPHNSLESIGAFFKRKSEEWIFPEEDVKGSSRTREDFLAQYSYANVGKTLSIDDKEFISEAFGKDLFQSFGYKP